MNIRSAVAGDRERIREILVATARFTAQEVGWAMELVEKTIDDPNNGDYLVAVLEEPDSGPNRMVQGYVCYGPTPMTEGTWDLYWIVTHPDARGNGVARGLVVRMEAELKALGARLVRVETSRLDGYGAAHAFYERLAYPVSAVMADFYKPGDDLVVMLKRL